MQGDDDRLELHRHGERAEGALQAHPRQRDHRPGGADGQLAPARPAGQGQGGDEDAHARGQVAVDHLDPGLGMRHRSGGHGGLGLADLLVRAPGRELAIAAGPVGAAQAGIGQAHEGAEHDQVQRQEPGQEHQFAIACEQSGRPVRCGRIRSGGGCFDGGACDAAHQPIREFFSRVRMSSRTASGCCASGKRIIR